MTVRTSDARRPRNGCGYALLIVLAVVAAACIGGFAWFNEQFDDDPPHIGAPYDEAEALLAMEAFAGELIAALPSDDDSPRFSNRVTESSACTWGWDGHREWDGLVSVSISYDFHRDFQNSEVTGIKYAELIIAKLEALGIDPEVDHVEKWNEKRVRAQRDDGLGIHYDSSGLYISAGCVPDEGEVVYTPPHGGVPPAGDDWLRG